jgi:hypothetical protein
MRLLHLGLVGLLCGLWFTDSIAQELTPRLFWPTPKGTKVLVAGYSYSAGGLFFDYSIPIEDADSTINTGILAYTQTLGLFGRTSNILLNLPYSEGTAKGLLLGDPVKTDFSAFGDLGVTLNVNLKGAPTMNREDFMAFRANPQPIIGTSLKVVFPTGNYDSDKLINVGSNRWAARFKLGAVLLLKPTWLLELSVSASWFGDDDDFLMGKKEQDPIYALETNLIKRIRPGLWASLDVTFWEGGRQTINGDPLSDAHRNVKLGGTFVFPFLGHHAVKIGYANGVITRYGNDFDQFLLSYQVALR